MGLKSTYLFLGVFLLFGWQAQAQISCTYTLELYDSFGDGWNGSVLTVSIDGNATDYTLFNDANDSFNSFPIVVTEGQEVSLSYSPGTFEGEVTYFLYDSDGNLTFSDGPNPTVGTDIFTFTSVCPSCPSVLSNSVSVDDIRAYYADVSWIPTDPDGVYLLEFGLPGFMNGDGTVIEADGGSGRLQPLEENTMYEFYLSVACSNGDTSQIIGPFAFTTRFANDVGIVMLDSPVTGCGLGISEELSVTLFNFGGLPQSLIPFNYSVNGIPGGVNQPIDGFFTGVLGTDSLFTIPFDMNYDFSEFGDYEIMVWTELDDDSVISNDTFTVTITNIPVISELPYFENYESGNGGWTVGEASVNGTWAYGMPAGAMISEAASGEFAWVTNLEGSYNNSELAYLQSPCFDFSNLPADPRISFSLFFDSESCCDEAWLEVSTDAGASWTKVGTSGTGSNWYNDTFNNWWDGTGGFTGWVTAQNDLTGTAGSSDVIVRFVFSSDGSVVREGVGVDDILIAPILAADLAADSGNDTSEAVCGDPANSVVINVKNDGYEAQNGFSVGYAVNGGDAVTETVPGDFSIEPGEIMPYTFTTTFASTEPGDYTVAVWTDLTGDGLALNDTTYFTFTVAPTIAAYPYYQDFESGNGGWTVDAASTNSSWAFGEPAGAVITAAASGMNA
ncbi:MAG: hypothetical protein KDC54_09890, partial [Lewinella sp.]|nr:hypothetical protein [Lewinella sp.]